MQRGSSDNLNLPKVATNLTNAASSKKQIRNMLASASITRSITAHHMRRTACRDEMQGVRRSEQTASQS